MFTHWKKEEVQLNLSAVRLTKVATFLSYVDGDCCYTKKLWLMVYKLKKQKNRIYNHASGSVRLDSGTAVLTKCLHQHGNMFTMKTPTY